MLECIHRVTLLAAFTELPLMDIIRFMTIIALGRCPYLFAHGQLMAGLAFDARMRTLQLVVSLGVMVELP